MYNYEILVTVLCFTGVLSAKTKGEMMTDVLNKVLKNYDARVPPNYIDFIEKTTVVSVSAYVLRGISYKDELLTVEAYVREKWNDPRLAYEMLSDLNETITTIGFRGRIWEPDTFIANGKTEYREKEMFYRIGPKGDAFKSTKMTITVECNMDVRKYPMDVQLCPISLESYGYTMKDINYKFISAEAVGFGQDVTVGDYHLFASRQKESQLFLTSGNYSRLEIQLLVSRDPSFHIKYFFVPAILTFFVSWAIFWLPASSVLLRGILGVVSLKVTMGLMGRGAHDLPHRESTMTLLDKYMVTCAVLALVAILQSIGAFYLYTNRPRKSEEDENDLESAVQKKAAKDSEKEKLGISDYLEKGTKYALTLRHHRRSHAKVDLLFRIFYPIFFLLFNIVFWITAYVDTHPAV